MIVECIQVCLIPSCEKQALNTPSHLVVFVRLGVQPLDSRAQKLVMNT